MIKSEIVVGLRKAAGGADFISQKEINAYLGYKDPHTTRALVHGLARIGTRYYVPEVAERIMGEIRREDRLTCDYR